MDDYKPLVDEVDATPYGKLLRALQDSDTDEVLKLLDDNPDLFDESGQIFAIAADRLNCFLRVKRKICTRLARHINPSVSWEGLPMVYYASMISTELIEELVQRGASVNVFVPFTRHPYVYECNIKHSLEPPDTGTTDTRLTYLYNNRLKQIPLLFLMYEYYNICSRYNYRKIYAKVTNMYRNILEVSSLNINIKDNEGNNLAFLLSGTEFQYYYHYYIELNFNHRNKNQKLFWEVLTIENSINHHLCCNNYSIHFLIDKGRLLPENGPPKRSRCCIM